MIQIIPIHSEHQIGGRLGLFLGRANDIEPIAPTQVAAYATPEGARAVVVFESSQPRVVNARIVTFHIGYESLSPTIYLEPFEGTSAASVAAWADGSFVIVYVRTLASGRQILARMYNWDGSPKIQPGLAHDIPIPVAVDQSSEGYTERVQAPTVTALRMSQNYSPDGTVHESPNYWFAVAWSTGIRDEVQGEYKSIVSFRIIDGLMLTSTDRLADQRTSATNPDYNACVQIVEIAPWLVAWAYQSDNGWVSSRVKPVMARDDTDSGEFRIGGDFPSIAVLRPGSISSIDRRFGYVVAVRSQVVPANPDMWQIINYEAYGARQIPGSPFYVEVAGRNPPGQTANQTSRPHLVALQSRYPAVAGLLGPYAGRFVITWGEGASIIARVFAENGQPISDEQTIVTDPYARIFQAQSIVALPDGSFYLVYMSGIEVEKAWEYTIKAMQFTISDTG
jgi:hypothetical protein